MPAATMTAASAVSVAVKRRRPRSLRALTYSSVLGARITVHSSRNFSPAASKRNTVYAVAIPATIVSLRRVLASTFS